MHSTEMGPSSEFVLARLCLSALVCFGIIEPLLAAPEDNLASIPISIENLLSGKYSALLTNATWISDSELIYKDKFSNCLTFNVETNKITILANLTEFPLQETFTISPDRQYLLISRDFKKIYRHSGLARYDILDLKTKNVVELSAELLQLAEWGPEGNSLIYIHGNNIFFKANVKSDVIQITNNGENQKIFNGICDWVYEEEIFLTKTAIWISPDKSKMAYVQLNDSEVIHINIPIYGEAGNPKSQYPNSIDFSYPKAGTRNPIVKLFLVNLTGTDPANEKVQIQPPEEFLGTEHIIGMVEWANNETLLTTWLNRVQNDSIVQICKESLCHNLMNIKTPGAWLDMKHRKYNKDGSKFVYLASQYQSISNDSYQHLTLVSTDTGEATALTSGEFVVLSILYWNFDSDVIYYAANAKNAPHIKHIWSVLADQNVDGERKPICYTCDISRNGIPQTYFEASFSPNGTYIMLGTLGPSIPRTDIVKIDSNNRSGFTFIRNWEDNHQLKELLINSSQPIKNYHKIKLNSGFDAFVKLQLPPELDESSTTKYPMLIHVYGGPNAFLGDDRWDLGFADYLVTNPKYIVAQINGRGSGNRGDKLMHQIYRKMGTVEIDDQIEVASKLAASFQFIDEKKIAIWGWSYGGYVAGMALAKDDKNVFKCAASVAPVTDWTYYDTIYTERYMGLPINEDNAIGYENARLSTLYSKFENRKYLLVHGTLDDNVHYQQAMALVRQLELHDIQFEQITYPDEDHRLASVRKHLFHALHNYFNRCFE